MIGWSSTGCDKNRGGMKRRAATAGLAFFALAGAEPASADVIELNADGTVLLRAADRPTAAIADLAIEGDQAVGLQLPADAITMTTASTSPVAYAGLVDQLAEAHGLSPALIEAVVWQESRWRSEARSPVGAIGLAQLMPGTARDLGVNPLDPASNLAGGARYLRQQLDRFGGDVELALAAYNAGPGRVARAGGIPRIRETQNYVRSIVDRLTASTNPQGKAR